MKKRTLVSALAAALALFVALVSIPLPGLKAEPAQPEPAWTVPEGYNEHDYSKAVALLEQTDENGIKNGEKLDPRYDPNDPDTWGYTWGFDLDGNYSDDLPRFLWKPTSDGLQLAKVYLHDCYPALCGEIDLADCLSLIDLECLFNAFSGCDVSNCISLLTLDLYHNQISEDTFSAIGCYSLRGLDVSFNDFSVLPASLPESLQGLGIGGNRLTELDLREFPNLTGLECSLNPDLTRVDLSNCYNLCNVFQCFECSISELILPDQPIALLTLNAYSNKLSSIDLSVLPELRTLSLQDNNLAELDVSFCSHLIDLAVNDNDLDSLDISGLPDLNNFYCVRNNITELDMSNNTHLPYDRVCSDGNGTIGFSSCEMIPGIYDEQYSWAYAVCSEGSSFLGWYNEAGDLISGELTINWNGFVGTTDVLIARFSGGPEPVLPGDIDMNGEVTVSDAIMALRAAMGILELTSEQVGIGDMDQNGGIEVSDAIMILRTAMGLI
ncbi:MAG: hypothetical protein IJM18_01660 [Clostridia bacterium]|nr:hypothetical protein [Clostridia bacterium]